MGRWGCRELLVEVWVDDFPGSVEWGSGGRGFKSRRPDYVGSIDQGEPLEVTEGSG